MIRYVSERKLYHVEVSHLGVIEISFLFISRIRSAEFILTQPFDVIHRCIISGATYNIFTARYWETIS